MKTQFLRVLVIGIVLLVVFNSGAIFASTENSYIAGKKQMRVYTRSAQVSAGNEIDPAYFVYLPFIQSWISVPDEMVHVPPGEFLMGCDNDNPTGYCEDDEQPVHAVYLDAFFMDIYEVTNAKYAQCVAEGPCTLPSKDYSNLRESYYNNPAYADYPVIWVDWNQANTYCDWVGKRLPTEAEFEKASRDNSTRMYPWGDQMPDCSLTNFQADAGHCVNDTTPVGSYPTGASPYGVLDIAGNVGEWTNDWYDSNYYSYSPYRNPTGPATGEMRVVRSGCWNGDWEILRSVNKASFTVVNNQNKLGFRCVLSP